MPLRNMQILWQDTSKMLLIPNYCLFFSSSGTISAISSQPQQLFGQPQVAPQFFIAGQPLTQGQTTGSSLPVQQLLIPVSTGQFTFPPFYLFRIFIIWLHFCLHFWQFWTKGILRMLNWSLYYYFATKNELKSFE